MQEDFFRRVDGNWALGSTFVSFCFDFDANSRLNVLPCWLDMQRMSQQSGRIAIPATSESKQRQEWRKASSRVWDGRHFAKSHESRDALACFSPLNSHRLTSAPKNPKLSLSWSSLQRVSDASAKHNHYLCERPSSLSLSRLLPGCLLLTNSFERANITSGDERRKAKYRLCLPRKLRPKSSCLSCCCSI